MKKTIRSTGQEEWEVYNMVPTARMRFQRHRFAPFLTVASLSTFGTILPATSELHPTEYALFTGASGFTKTEASFTLEESLSGAEE